MRLLIKAGERSTATRRHVLSSPQVPLTVFAWSMLMRVLSLLLIAVAAIAHSSVVSAQQGPPLNSAQWASTTRIETQRVYGAVVTYESGVRVFRPIPPTQHMIINPDGQAPLLLGIIGKNGVRR